MPIMQVHYREDALRPDQKAALAQRLNEVLLEMEGGARTRAGKAFAWVMFYPLKPDDWYIGGETGDALVAPPGRFLVHVTIPEGYMNAAHKSEVHAAVNAAILAATGTESARDAGASVLVVIDEVTEGNWGAKGRTISIASISESVGLPKHGERYAWVTSYFEAKARLYAAAGFPTDIGGVPGARR
jgi:phenylpyruvate tautomerase PptA (4-oxalocrotonate tautomerase family)